MLINGVILVLFLGCTGASPGAGEPAAAKEDESGQSKAEEDVQFEAGEIVTLQGVVTRNVRACEVDGPCFLEVRTEDGECTVNYAEPRGRPCPNVAAIDAGFALKAGDEIEVRALATGGSYLTTCKAEELFIKKVTEGTGREGGS